MNSISINVLITTFNSQKYIKETIDSVLNQTQKDYRIIIVDECSTDKTFDICKKYRDKHKDKLRFFKKLNKKEIILYEYSAIVYNYLTNQF